MRISDWSSDVCSSDLPPRARAGRRGGLLGGRLGWIADPGVSSTRIQALGSGGAEFRDRLFALGARGFGALELVGHRLPRGGGAQIAVADLPQCRFRSLGAALGGLCQIEFAGGDRKSTRLNSSH